MNNLHTTESLDFLRPDWNAPPSVQSLITTRVGGFSVGSYQSLNLGDHVGDLPEIVSANRALLRSHIPAEPVWLKQVHGCRVSTPSARVVEADAIISDAPSEVLAIMTADCLPVLFSNRSGTVIGAAHAGWRGLCNGILENTVQSMRELAISHQKEGGGFANDSIMAWFGPAIGPKAFEVGKDVVEAFQSSEAGFPSNAFKEIEERPGKYLADIYWLARNRLQAVGVENIAGGDYCTVTQSNRFFSYRRDGVTGRFASLIWIDDLYTRELE